MQCELARSLLSQKLDGEIAPERLAELQAHVGRCPACKAFENGLAADRQATRALQAVTEPTGLKRRIIARLMTEAEQRRSARLFSWIPASVPTWSLLLAIAAGVAAAQLPWPSRPAVEQAFIGEERVTTFGSVPDSPAFRQVMPLSEPVADGIPAAGAMWSRSVNVTIEANAIDPARQALVAAIRESGGAIMRSGPSGDLEADGWTIAAEVPAGAVDALLRNFPHVGRVRSIVRSQSDLAAEFTGVASRLRVARDQESRYLEAMEQAPSDTEKGAIEASLAGVRAEIEQLMLRQAELDRRAASSTLQLSLVSPLE